MGAPSALITARFLKRKLAEYEALKAEIAQPTSEVERQRGNTRDGEPGS